jgi:hypothetical protein
VFTGPWMRSRGTGARARGISREGESQDVIDRSHLCRSVHDRALLEHGIIIIIITDAFNSLFPTPRPDYTEPKHARTVHSRAASFLGTIP